MWSFQMKLLYCSTSSEWREWLQQNFDQESGIWLVFYRTASGVPSIEYEAAVDEALCYGWIDSLIKKIDEEKYARKFTPRKDGSKLSESNKKRECPDELLSSFIKINIRQI
jgi:uncharacterized protein YdeI (YjbR/CyaY-like superfamily)